MLKVVSLYHDKGMPRDGLKGGKHYGKGYYHYVLDTDANKVFHTCYVSASRAEDERRKFERAWPQERDKDLQESFIQYPSNATIWGGGGNIFANHSPFHQKSQTVYAYRTKLSQTPKQKH